MCCITTDRFCCMRLPTAGFVIGWVSAKIAVIQSIIYIIVLANKEAFANHVNSIRSSKLDDISETRICGAVSVYLGIAVLDILASIMLIFGTHRNSHLMLLPWLINIGITSVIKVIFSCVLLFAAASNGGHYWLVIIIFIITGIYCWAWNAIYSLFQSIRNTNTRSQQLSYGNPNIFPSPKLELLNNIALDSPEKF